eukprot:scaffold350_cov333-Pavlova_lutheri.AAC.1
MARTPPRFITMTSSLTTSVSEVFVAEREGSSLLRSLGASACTRSRSLFLTLMISTFPKASSRAMVYTALPTVDATWFLVPSTRSFFRFSFLARCHTTFSLYIFSQSSLSSYSFPSRLSCCCSSTAEFPLRLHPFSSRSPSFFPR